MAQSPSPFDPMAIWRDLVAQWEKGTNEFASQAMTSDPFRQGMHGGMNASLQAQKAVGELMARFLTLLNLPTRNDIQALGDQLQRIDDHLGQIARLLESGGKPAAARGTAVAAAAETARPRRTKQPPRPPEPPAAAPVKSTRKRKS
jgi:hypothetical protein